MLRRRQRRIAAEPVLDLVSLLEPYSVVDRAAEVVFTWAGDGLPELERTAAADH
jgi:hypothetical protein